MEGVVPSFCALLVLLALTTGAQGQPAVEEVNSFAFRLYDKLATKSNSENVFFSPLNVAAAFSVLHLGAHGNTQKELNDTFGFEDKAVADELLRGSRTTLVQNNTDDDVEILIASNLFLQEGFGLEPAFKIRLTKTESKKPAHLNFTTDPEGSRKAINKFISTNTMDNIQGFIPKGAVDETTRMVVANAVFFKGGWRSPFNKSSTVPMEFKGFGKNKEVDMMVQEARLKLVPFSRAQVLELPYGTGAASMVIFLPDKAGKEAFFQLEKDIEGVNLVTLLNETRTTKVNVFLPKFEVKETVDLTQVLPKLGVKDLFDVATADLSGLSDTEGLYISSAFHTAKVTVDEEGTTASGATGAVAASKINADPIKFKANRPFIYFIIDGESKVILFMGSVRKLPERAAS